MKKRIFAIVLCIALVASLSVGLAACNNDEDLNEVTMPAYDVADVDYSDLTFKSDFKVGLICLHDENSTYDKNFIESMKATQTKFGLSDDQVLIATGVDEDINATYQKAVDLINQGCDVIFADSFGHENGLLKAAAEYPNVQFAHATGTQAHTSTLTNISNGFASIYEGRYLAGVAAGMKLNEMIEAGKITAAQAKMGYVGAYPYAEVVSGYTSFYLGAKSVCPSVTMDVTFTGSWYDETAEYNSAKSLIADDCVLISQHADSMGAPNACEEENVPNISYNGSTLSACPDTFIISSRIDWSPYYEYVISQKVQNLAVDKDWIGTIKTGSVVLTNLGGNAMAEGTVEKLVEVRNKLVAGTVKVFDVNTFTVDGKKISTYMADVDTDAAFTADTEVVKTENGITFIAESFYRAAPYFALDIDGITKLN